MALVRPLVGAAFVLGSALILFYSSSNAIFLTRYDSSVLPWVYIVNALAVVLVGALYGVVARRLAGGAALVWLMAALTTSVAAMWLWTLLSDDRVVAFLLATWFRLLFIYAVLGLWEIASAVFDIRQAKRLFPAVALGMMLAFVVGGALSPVIGAAIGATHMVGGSAFLLAAYTVLFSRLLRRGDVTTSTGDASVPAGPRDIARDAYSRRMALMKIITITLLYATEYVFYQQASEVFDSEAALAGFFGTFMGVTTLVMVVVTAVVSGRFISRYGVRVATAALPAGMLMVTVVAGSYGTFVAIDLVFFGLVCVALATNHILGHAISDPAGAVLFQPMPAARRMRVRLAIDGWVGAGALIASGVTLLVLAAVDLGEVTPFLWLIAAVAAAGVVVAGRQFQDYVAILREVTTLGFVEGTRSFDPLDRSALEEHVRGEDPATIVAAGSLLRSVGGRPLAGLAIALAQHDDPEVVTLAVDALSATSDRAHADALLSILERQDLPAPTLARVLRGLASIAPDAAAGWLARHDAAAFDPVRPLILAQGADGGRRAIEELTRLGAGSTAERTAAASALADVDPLPIELARRLIGDQDPHVAATALTALNGSLPADLATTVLEAAERPGTRRAALATLARADVADLPVLDTERLAATPGPLRADLVTAVVARSGRPEPLHRLLTVPQPPRVRTAVYRGLADVGEHGRDAQAAHALAEIERASRIRALIAELASPTSLVGLALDDDLTRTEEALLAALALSQDARRTNDIATLLSTGSDDDRANAVEALELALPAELRRSVIAIVEPRDTTPAGGGGDPSGEVLQRIATDRDLSDWTRRVADQARRRTEGRADGPDGDEPVATDLRTVIALKRVDIFSSLPYDAVVELADLVESRGHRAGTVILEAGTVGEEMFALTEGEVDVVPLAGTATRLRAPTVFGELALLDPAPRSASVTAVTDIEVLVIDRRTLLSLVDRRPIVMSEIARVLARRLRA